MPPRSMVLVLLAKFAPFLSTLRQRTQMSTSTSVRTLERLFQTWYELCSIPAMSGLTVGDLRFTVISDR